MQPDTIELLKQLVRQLKGILTAFDKWINSKSKETKERDKCVK